jgi:hypothetical protein
MLYMRFKEQGSKTREISIIWSLSARKWQHLNYTFNQNKSCYEERVLTFVKFLGPSPARE